MLDFAGIFTSLSRRLGWTADQIADLSIPQLVAYMDGLANPSAGVDPRDGKPTIRFGSVEEALAYRRQRQGR